MKKLYLFFAALLVSALTFGQSIKLVQETFGSSGTFWEGPLNTNPNLVSDLEFTADKLRTQTWNASSGYDEASGKYHGILAGAQATDTVSFRYTPLDGFHNFTFALGVFSWGAPDGQFDFEYSYDSIDWVLFDEAALLEGDRYGAGWQKYVFSEQLNPTGDYLYIKFYRTADQVHCDDIMIWAEPTENNAYLSGIDLDVGSVSDFDPLSFDLEAWVPYGTTATPVITANTYAAEANVTINNATDITSETEADRTSTITVQAKDGSVTNVYNVVFNVTPPRTDATLAGIDLAYGTLAPGFSSGIMKYIVELPDTATMAPEVTPIPSDEEAATFVVTAATDVTAADEASRTTSIEVTAQDGETTMTYSIVFSAGESSDLMIIDMETFGDVGNKFGALLTEYPGFTSNWIWAPDTANIRTSNPSTGYDLASGANRMELQAGWSATGWDTVHLQATTAGFKNVTLATGVYGNSGWAGAAKAAFTADYSTDSVTWTSVGNTLTLGTEWPTTANTWAYVIIDHALPADDTLYMMFSNDDPNHEYWLDDITLWGTPVSTNNQLGSLELSLGTLSPAFDPNVTEYTVDLPQFTSETPTATYGLLSASATDVMTEAADVRSDVEADRTTTIEVTAENGDVRTYTIVYNVFMSSDATLSELSAGNLVLSPVFDNDISSYAVKLPAGTTEAPAITATPNDDVSEVTIVPAADINSQDVADRTATIDVVAEDGTTRHFEIVFTFGSLDDLRFTMMHEAFSTTGTFEAEAYPGYTSAATFDGDEHKYDNTGSEGYPMASGGAAIKFGDWSGEKYTELMMTYNVQGYKSILLSFAIKHESNGWGENGCGLTNNFTVVEYSTDGGTTWMGMNEDSLTVGSADWPCGGEGFSFVDLAEEIPVDDQNNVVIRISHGEPNIHPYHMDDIVLTGSPISADASLFDLTSAEGDLDPLFDPFVYEYAVELPYGTAAAPTLTATAAEGDATVDIVDATDINSDQVADRTSTITVTAPDGVSQQVYTVVFSVAPNNDATLSGLTVSEGELDPAFSVTTFDYTVELPGTTTQAPTVTATPTDSNADVVVNDAADVLSTNAADKTTTVVVTAEDGTTSLTYSILWDVRVSAASMEAGKFALYPNPVTEKLFISDADAIGSVTVTSITGQVMKIEQAHSDQSLELDVSGLEQGYYLISIESVNGNIISKGFIKE